jgi:autotransporter-associated beta strand protein
MTRITIRRRRTSRTSGQRLCRPRIEVLEDRVTPAVSLTNLYTFPSAEHPPYDPPAVDSSDNVYTTISTGAVSLYRDSTLVASFQNASTASLGAGGLNNGLAIDSVGDVFGPYEGALSAEGVFEVPHGATQFQLVPVQISGPLDVPFYSGENIEGLAVSNGNLYGVSVGFSAVGTDPTTGLTMQLPVVSVWQVPVTGGTTNLLAQEQYPWPGQFGEFQADGLTLSNGVLYGVTTGGGHGDDSVFSVPVGGGPFKLTTFASGVGAELAVTDNAIYGTVPFNNDVFKLPIGGGTPQISQITVGSNAVGGLVKANGTILGVLANNGALGKGSIFSVDFATPTPTMATVATFATLNESPLSGLAVDSSGNAYGVAHSQSGVAVFKLNGPPPPTNFTWSGFGVNWSDPHAWVGDVAPKAGQTVNLVFPAGTGANFNTDDIVGLQVGTIQFGMHTSLNGSTPLTLVGSLTDNAPNQLCELNMPLKLVGNVTATVRAGELALGGVISGSGGITIVGPGELALGNANTYTGNTVVKSGTLGAVNNHSLGTGTLDLEGGTLTANGASPVLENAVIIGANVTITADTDSAQGLRLDGKIQVTKTSVLTVADRFRSSNSLSVLGTNTLTIQKGNPASIHPDVVASLGGSISGHVRLSGLSIGLRGQIAAALAGDLMPGAVLDVLNGTTLAITGALTGSGAMNVAGGTLECVTELGPEGEQRGADLSRYNGTVTLQPSSEIMTNTALGDRKSVV